MGLQIIGPVPSATYWDREFADSPLEEGGFELVVPLCLGIDIVIGDSSLVPREFGLARQAYGAIAW